MNNTDIIQQFEERLQQAGLVFDHLNPTEKAWHICGTVDRPHSQNGRYRFHLDPPANVSWKNRRTGEEGVFLAEGGPTFTAAEKEAQKVLRAQEKAIREQADSESYAKTAAQAQGLWDTAQPADPEHPYLVRKGVPALGIRQRGNMLLVPILDDSGKVLSLQYIMPKKGSYGRDKDYLKGKKKPGGFFCIPARGNSKDGPLLIAEGYATAASLHMATGYAVLVAFDTGGLKPVATVARARYPDREIILAADNDCMNKDGSPRDTNPGVEAATRAAQAISAKLAICPSHEGRSTDFNDLHLWRSLEAVRVVVEAARKEPDPCPMPEGFFLVPEGNRAGLYKLETKPDGDNNEIRLGPPLFIRGMTRDVDSNSWGLMLEWHDPDGKLHQWAMPLELLSKQGGEWHCSLANGGWFGVPGTKSKLAAFLSLIRPQNRIRCVPRVGWHNEAFVLPDAVYGAEAAEKVVLQSDRHAQLYRTSGTPEGWQELARLAIGNSRLEFVLCTAFAGLLLEMSGVESGGFNLVGGSSSGKTTALRLAASVWDSPAYVRSWRTTDNALEGLAALHNDTLLILDELGMASAKVISESAYMLTNGQGKSRANRGGDARKTHTWRLLFLSSGEGGLADKLSEIGMKPHAGQEVRLVDVPADAGKGMHIFEELHGFDDAGTLSLRIKELAEQHYGHAGRSFLQALTAERESVAAEIRPALAELVKMFCPMNVDGQVQRVALRFAVCALGGHLAVQMGILPPELDARGCAQRCFDDWLSARGGIGASEDAAILSAVRLFIEQHGASRFEDMDTQTPQRIPNRVGFKHATGSGIEYVFLPESFKSEVVKGYSERRAARVLTHAGWLCLERPGRFKARRTLPGMGLQDCYVVMLPENEEAEQ